MNSAYETQSRYLASGFPMVGGVCCAATKGRESGWERLDGVDPSSLLGTIMNGKGGVSP